MTGRPISIGFIRARGGGSSFYRKNAYPILGRPVLAWAIDILKQAGFMQHIYVWTEDSELLDIAANAGAIPLERPKDMVHYYSGWPISQWYRMKDQQIEEHLGSGYDYITSFNCNCIGLRPESLKIMYKKLLVLGKDGFRIQAISPASGGLCLTTPENRNLFPFWNDINKPIGKGMPPLYRSVGASIVHRTRANTGDIETLHHIVREEEGFDFQNPDDVPFAEFYLKNKKMLRENK